MSFDFSFIVYNPQASDQDIKKILTFKEDEDEDDGEEKSEEELLSETTDSLRKFFFDCIQKFPPYLFELPEDLLPEDFDEDKEILYQIHPNHIEIFYFADVTDELNKLVLKLAKKHKLGFWDVEEQKLVFSPPQH